MGRRAKKREAYQRAAEAAAKQYYEAFEDLQPVNEKVKAETNTRRALREGDFNSRIKRIGREMDETGRLINEDTDYKRALSRYNDRYEALKLQVANKSSTRYSVRTEPDIKVPNLTGNLGALSGLPDNSNDKFLTDTGPSVVENKSKPNGLSSFGTFQSKPFVKKGVAAADRKYFETAEEAQAEAVKSMEKYNADQAKQRDAARGIYNPNQQYRPQIKDPSKFIQEETMPGISTGWAQLNDFGDAFEELGVYAERAKASPVNQYAERYTELSKQLNAKLKRETTAPSQGLGLLSSELATANPISEALT